MTLYLVLLLWLVQPATGSFGDAVETSCQCPTVTNIQKMGGGSDSFTFSWTGTQQADHYKVYYFRQEGNFTSSHFTTANTSYTFEGMPSGNYTFFVGAVCGEGVSEFIGLEEIILH